MVQGNLLHGKSCSKDKDELTNNFKKDIIPPVKAITSTVICMSPKQQTHYKSLFPAIPQHSLSLSLHQSIHPPLSNLCLVSLFEPMTCNDHDASINQYWSALGSPARETEASADGRVTDTMRPSWDKVGGGWMSFNPLTGLNQWMTA